MGGSGGLMSPDLLYLPLYPLKGTPKGVGLLVFDLRSGLTPCRDLIEHGILHTVEKAHSAYPCL